MKTKEAPDWFGCGRIITTESWNGFLAAQKKYYEEKDNQKQTMKPTSQAARILARLQQGGRVPMPELSRYASGKPDGWVASFSKRISDLRCEGHTIICHEFRINGARHTFYELIK